MAAFVGRGDELAALTRTVAQSPVLVLIEGEAGIGKTRLVQEWSLSGGWADSTVLMVECQPVAQTAPLGAVVEGVRRLRERISDLELSPLAGVLRPLLPEWSADLPPSPESLDEAGARRHRLFRALTELVDRLGVDLVVVEDAHWADQATLEWLSAACGSGAGRSVVVTYRREDVPSGSALWQLTSRRPPRMGKLHLELEPLDAGGVRQLARSMFRTAVSQEFTEFLYRRTGGLPLAVVECLKLMRDRGDITRKEDGWSRRDLADIRVPPTVRDSVLERVAQLSPRTRRVLAAAAILDEPADERLLAAVADLVPSEASAGVAAGFRAGLLRGAGGRRVAFKHQLAAEAVAGQIPAPDLARLHQRAGEALRADDNAPVVRLSHHFRMAGDTEAWATYAEQGADLAVQSGDDHTAVTVLYELLTSVDHPPDRRARLARKLGETAAGGAARLANRAGQVIDALRQVLSDPAVPPGERGAIRLQLGRLLRWYGQPEAADHEIEAAIPDLADQPGLACRAMLNLAIALSRDWPVAKHLEWLDRATVQIPRIESPAERLTLAAIRVSALLALGEEKGWQAAEELPQVDSGPFEQRTVVLGMIDIGRLAISWGRHAEAAARLDKATEGIRASGYQRALNTVLIGRAYLDWRIGRWDGLGQTAARLATADSTEQDQLRNEAREIQGLVALATGDRETAEELLSATLQAHARTAPLGHLAAITAGGLGRIRLADGPAEQALQVTEPVMARIARKGLWLWSVDLIWVHLDALAAAGRLEQVEELADEFAGWVAGRNVPAAVAASLLCQGILAQSRGDLDKAGELYAQAADAWAGLPRPYDALLALERRGLCLLATGETGDGLAVLSTAEQRLRGLGARWDADRVTTVLRQHRAHVAHPKPKGYRGRDGQLSPRELEVLELVARGLTNPEAGRELFLSPKTVGHYLSSAMRKLNVTTRTGAATAAINAGLVPPSPREPRS